MMKLWFLVIMLWATSLPGADLTLTWDPKPPGVIWTAVRIYEKGATGDYTKVGEVDGAATSITLNVVPGVHSYVGRAVNVWESADSNVVTTPPQPVAPGGFKIVVTVTVTVP